MTTPLFAPVDFKTAERARHRYFASLSGPKVFEAGYNRHYIGGTPSGALSIKCMFNAPATYITGDAQRFAVDDSAYLILNRHQGYTIIKDADVNIESFCIFFPDDLAERVFFALNESPSRLLDQPENPIRGSITFRETLYPHDGVISPIIARLRARYYQDALDRGELEEAMIRSHHTLEKSPAKRQPPSYGARLELQKRLQLAREFIIACAESPLTLADMAQVAALSPYHFLREFKRTFGQTPHSYLSHHRIEKARRLLYHTQLPVTEICWRVGFHSVGSFSTLFRRQTGLSPRTYRMLLR